MLPSELISDYHYHIIFIFSGPGNVNSHFLPFRVVGLKMDDKNNKHKHGKAAK